MTHWIGTAPAPFGRLAAAETGFMLLQQLLP